MILAARCSSLVGALFALAVFAGAIEPPLGPETPAGPQRLDRFREARLGLLIHWGLYSIPGGQWLDLAKNDYGEGIMKQADIAASDYEPLAKKFNPTRFDAASWVKLAKEAGMKYLIVTAKHHDGFCLFDSALTDYDVVDATPFKRDPLMELAKACREEGIALGVYYSVVDWHHPEFPARHSQDGFHGRANAEAKLERYNEYQRGQVRELLTKYGPLSVLWFDHGGAFAGVDRGALLQADEQLAEIRQRQPDCLVNDRLGRAGDYESLQQEIPREVRPEQFEVCTTLNRHGGFNHWDNDWKSAQAVARHISDVASKGGNYLLTIGPRADGTIPAEPAKILREVGEWTQVNGEAIYGTGPTPWGTELGRHHPQDKDTHGQPVWVEGEDYRCTVRNGKVYVFLWKWPTDGAFLLPLLENRVTAAYFLSDTARTHLKTWQNPQRTGVMVMMPRVRPDQLIPVLCIEVHGETVR